MSSRYLQTALLAYSILCIAGCGGGGAKSVHVNRVTTVGQELNDLHEAHKKGALSDSEYAEQKARILRGSPVD